MNARKLDFDLLRAGLKRWLGLSEFQAPLLPPTNLPSESLAETPAVAPEKQQLDELVAIRSSSSPCYRSLADYVGRSTEDVPLPGSRRAVESFPPSKH